MKMYVLLNLLKGKHRGRVEFAILANSSHSKLIEETEGSRKVRSQGLPLTCLSQISIHALTKAVVVGAGNPIAILFTPTWVV